MTFEVTMDLVGLFLWTKARQTKLRKLSLKIIFKICSVWWRWIGIRICQDISSLQFISNTSYSYILCALNNMIDTMSIKTDFTFYISIYFLCSFKSILLYDIFPILIIIYCLTICTRFDGKIYISYTLIIYGPYGPLDFLIFCSR